jgi:hypothetical protein
MESTYIRAEVTIFAYTLLEETYKRVRIVTSVTHHLVVRKPKDTSYMYLKPLGLSDTNMIGPIASLERLQVIPGKAQKSTIIQSNPPLDPAYYPIDPNLIHP